MRIKALNIWYSIRSSYWFVPTLMAITAVVLAFITIAVDASVGQGWTRSLGKFFGNNPDAARLLLGTMAGAMITVAGVVFSVTILTLTMASAQFGHRLITNFIRDTGTQVVLGTFVATFLYCLLALLAVSSDTNGRFVPSISVTVSIVLALVSVGVLIFFVHHAAESIQAKSIVAKVSHDLDSLIHRVLPKESDDRLSSDAQNSILEAFAAGGSPIASASSGYLQAIDRGNLVKTAAEHDLILISQYRPGKFVVQGNALVLAWPEEKLDEQLAERIRNRFILGDQRTYEQDVVNGGVIMSHRGGRAAGAAAV
jgi:uncharacterized membrane protein